MNKLLVIDDSEDILRTITTYLAEYYSVLTAKFGEKGVEIFKKERPSVVVTDIKMPGMDGIDVLREIKTIDKDVEVILMTGNGEIDSVIKSLRLGASEFILKPMDIGLLEIVIERAFDKKKKKDELNQLLDGIGMSINGLLRHINGGGKSDLEFIKEELEKMNLRYEKWKTSP